jgi:hypothetical protein
MRCAADLLGKKSCLTALRRRFDVEDKSYRFRQINDSRLRAEGANELALIERRKQFFGAAHWKI